MTISGIALSSVIVLPSQITNSSIEHESITDSWLTEGPNPPSDSEVRSDQLLRKLSGIDQWNCVSYEFLPSRTTESNSRSGLWADMQTDRNRQNRSVCLTVCLSICVYFYWICMICKIFAAEFANWETFRRNFLGFGKRISIPRKWTDLPDQQARLFSVPPIHQKQGQPVCFMPVSRNVAGRGGVESVQCSPSKHLGHCVFILNHTEHVTVNEFQKRPRWLKSPLTWILPLYFGWLKQFIAFKKIKIKMHFHTFIDNIVLLWLQLRDRWLVAQFV